MGSHVLSVLLRHFRWNFFHERGKKQSLVLAPAWA